MSTIQYTLPRQYFVSEKLFREELEHIFCRHWICVGREDQIINPGDYFVQEVDTESVIILRDDKGAIRAFHNVCRHRGTRLCLKGQGHLNKTIQCPYHAWTYALNGNLIGVPGMSDMKDHFSKEEFPLHNVAVEIWEGFLFINMAPDPEPFQDIFGSVVDRFQAWHIPRLKSAHRIEYDVKANWKLIVENYNECYHCPLIHPELNRVAPADSGDNELVTGMAVGGYMTFREEMETMSLTGRSHMPVGEVDGDDLNRAYFYTLFPNLLLSLHPDYVMFHTLWPQGVDRTLVVCEWLFAPEVMAQPGFDPRDVVEFWDRTNRQDWFACEISQLGVGSRAYTPGPYYHWHEQLLAEFDRQVLRALGKVRDK
jgi:Rieske 2Fe-2S family protein